MPNAVSNRRRVLSLNSWLGCIAVASMWVVSSGRALAADPWVEGTHYFRLERPQPSTVPAGKIEVTEVFSYGCPACNTFAPAMRRLKQSLPANVVVTYVPASWNAAEAWPMFQRAYLTAKALGVAEKSHDAMFEAVWKTRELGILDARGQNVKSVLPTIEDAAKFYQRTAGIPAATFVSTAKSFSIELGMRQADQKIRAMMVDSTPTLIVAGKYRVDNRAAGGFAQVIALTQWLVARESTAKR